jgi:hypothetical protein
MAPPHSSRFPYLMARPSLPPRKGLTPAFLLSGSQLPPAFLHWLPQRRLTRSTSPIPSLTLQASADFTGMCQTALLRHSGMPNQLPLEFLVVHSPYHVAPNSFFALHAPCLERNACPKVACPKMGCSKMGCSKMVSPKMVNPKMDNPPPFNPPPSSPPLFKIPVKEPGFKNLNQDLMNRVERGVRGSVRERGELS